MVIEINVYIKIVKYITTFLAKYNRMTAKLSNNALPVHFTLQN